jgi:MOSC domain-containing protein YiiM
VTSARLLSVNVVHALIPDRAGHLDRTAIDKRPVSGRVQVSALGLDGDSQYDTKHHGGTEQAVYAYAREDVAWWEETLGRSIAPGQFGENLTTEGLDVTGAVLGERWRVGTVELAVTVPRIPCATFQGWMGEPRWVKRFTQRGRPGAYLQVPVEGELAVDDRIEVVHRPDHGVTVGDMFRALTGDKDQLARVAEVPDLSEKSRDVVRRLLPS